MYYDSVKIHVTNNNKLYLEQTIDISTTKEQRHWQHCHTLVKKIMLTMLLVERKIIGQWNTQSLYVYCLSQNSNDALPKATYSWNRF